MKKLAAVGYLTLFRDFKLARMINDIMLNIEPQIEEIVLHFYKKIQ